MNRLQAPKASATGQPSESAQVRRPTRTGSSHLAPLQAIIVDCIGAGKHFLRVASERTPIVPKRGESES